MNYKIYLFIPCLLYLSCAKIPKAVVKTSNHPRVVEYEPAVSEKDESRFQFEDENHYYAFSLSHEEQKEAEPILSKITTNPSQEIEIKYYQGGGIACLKSIEVDGEIFEKIEITRRCDMYVSWDKDRKGYHHQRMVKKQLTPLAIRRFLKKNPHLKKYQALMEMQEICPGMPKHLLYFMWGQPESHFTDEDKVTLLTYPDWYVSIKDRKVYSFSSKNENNF